MKWETELSFNATNNHAGSRYQDNKKSIKCFKCGKLGHVKGVSGVNCFTCHKFRHKSGHCNLNKYKDRGERKANCAVNSFHFVLRCVLSQDKMVWYADSGATDHNVKVMEVTYTGFKQSWKWTGMCY